MFELIVFIFICYGISNAVIHTDGPFYIFTYYRELMNKLPSNLGHGAECMICFPFRIGIYLSLLNTFFMGNYSLTPMNCYIYNNDVWFITCLLDGAIASGATWLLHTIQEYFEYNTPQEMEEDNGN